jgi:hypothetical protein
MARLAVLAAAVLLIVILVVAFAGGGGKKGGTAKGGQTPTPGTTHSATPTADVLFTPTASKPLRLKN